MSNAFVIKRVNERFCLISADHVCTFSFETFHLFTTPTNSLFSLTIHGSLIIIKIINVLSKILIPQWLHVTTFTKERF